MSLDREGALSVYWSDSRGSWVYSYETGELRDRSLPGFYGDGIA